MRRPWALPLVPLYAAGAALRSFALKTGLESIKHLDWPVISVGSLSAGGSGKTPFVIALALLLKQEGFEIDVLSRGYGRTANSVELVGTTLDPARYGDEPLLISQETALPVFVGARRFEAGKLAEAAQPKSRGRSLHLLDDGFQHRQLVRNIDIVLVSAEDLNDHLLPAGNLREPIAALKRATVLAVPATGQADEQHHEHDDEHDTVARLRQLQLTQLIWRFTRHMSVPPNLKSTKLLAFCGIARPDQFFTGLEQAGLTLTARRAFRDHQPFTEQDLQSLQQQALHSGATAMITTAKDQMRLAIRASQIQKMLPIHTAGLSIVFEEEKPVAHWLRSQLKSFAE